MADEKKTVKAVSAEAAPKKATATKAADTKAAPKKAPAKKEAAAKETVKKEAVTAVPEKKSAKTAAKKSELVMLNNRVVVQSKTPLYAVKHKKGMSPYVISKEEVKVTLVKSTIGAILVHKRTVEALGLKKIGQSKTFKKSPALDGMLFRVRHLIKVEEVK